MDGDPAWIDDDLRDAAAPLASSAQIMYPTFNNPA